MNSHHQRHLLVTLRHIDQLLTEAERALTPPEPTSVFAEFVPDATPAQRRSAHELIRRIRNRLERARAERHLPLPEPVCGGRWAARGKILFAGLAAAELEPRRLQGYGPLDVADAPALNRLVAELGRTWRSCCSAWKTNRPASPLRPLPGLHHEPANPASGSRLEVSPGPHLPTICAAPTSLPLERVLDRLEAVAAQWNLTSLHPSLTRCRQRLTRRDGLDVAVLGRFKAGKSSCFNHLVGRPVLPVGVVPVTAVITRLRYGVPEQAEIHFLNGARRRVPVAEISRYVSEQENPRNRLQVADVEIILPELRPVAPLTWVDTPGLDSALAHNSVAARQWLPEVGAALLAVSVDAPLSEADLALLVELRRHTPRVVLLLTKADLLDATQQAEVRDFVRAQLDRQGHPDVPVFLFSVRPEHASLQHVLRAHLLEPLIRQHHETAREILRHKTRSLVLRAIEYGEVARAAATRSAAIRRDLLAGLEEERRQFDLLWAELHSLVQLWSARALEDYLTRLQPATRTLQLEMITALDAQLPRWRGPLPARLAAWRAWVTDRLREELGSLSRSERALFLEPLNRARLHLSRTLRAFHDRLADRVRAALGVELSPVDFAPEIREPTDPPVHVHYAFDAAVTAIAWSIPPALVRRPLQRMLQRKTANEVEKNLSRLAAAWRDRVTDGLAELTRQAEQHTRAELESLEQSLAVPADPRPDNAAVLEELRTLEQALAASAVPSSTLESPA